ncbi:GNAT family N-acetyltransferase [Agromyces archimandritae]|uniref:GNAT family N-acetyltransferase n=1 Tax=Agromyces archimandritae TaxID=2781962 RepID=A0A975IR77_9MICO|nr:GNAT family N-acetyltransferase [Agromyces archimandritae]QTX05796.1 GNAT family N-acetyltransferase [Agromyces archimandritae]
MARLTLIPWSPGDLDLLRRANTPELMDQLGGVESDEQVRIRHGRYLALARDGAGQQFRVATEEHPEGIGIVGYWHHEHDGSPALETGWSIQAEHRGHGYAPEAARLALAAAAAAGETLPVHAYPRIDNAASNAVCRKAGFTLLGEAEFDANGHTLHVNDWVALPTASP